MIVSVRQVYTLAVFTLVAVAAVGCARRTARVVANPLSEARYNAPRSTAYDIDAWAGSMAARDRVRAEHIVRWKSELTTRAHFDFFPADDLLVRPMFHEDGWDQADREMIRGYLTRILKATRARRAFEDDPALRADEAQARRIVNYFNRYDRRPEA